MLTVEDSDGVDGRSVRSIISGEGSGCISGVDGTRERSINVEGCGDVSDGVIVHSGRKPKVW